MAFKNENARVGIAQDDKFQVGASDVDKDLTSTLDGFFFPYPSDPEFSWVYYDCNVTCMLDSGIVVHNTLPQVDSTADSLGVVDYDSPDMARVGIVNAGGVNLKSNDRYTDVRQRMAHSRYWFHLFGQAVRIGHQVPIPRLVSVGGVDVVPHDGGPGGRRQFAFNRIAPRGNFSGFILWHAGWSLWYTTLTPPRNDTVPAADPSAQVDRRAPVSTQGFQVPYDQPDDNSVKAAPVNQQVGFIDIVR